MFKNVKISEKIIIFITNAIKIESKIDSRRTKFRIGKNRKKHFPERLAFTTTVYYVNDATQLST